MTHTIFRWSAALVLLAASVGPAAAQGSSFGEGFALTPTETVAPGWTFTPSMQYGLGWDDNVLVVGREDQTVGDVQQIVSPRAELTFNGPRNRLSARYNGSLFVYRDLQELNNYDQRASFGTRRSLSRRLGVFVRGGAAFSPTTELVEFVNVPFLRTGSSIQDVRGGVDLAVSARTSLVATGVLERVHFDENPEFSHLLRGGYGIGAALALKRRLSERTALTADYDLKHARVGQRAEAFDIQNTAVGLEQRLSSSLRVIGAAGLSHLGSSVFGPARTGMHWRAGLTREYRGGGLDLQYARTFAPSYGFGGTTQNDDFSGRLIVKLSRNLYSRGAGSWRRAEPLTQSEARTRSVWIDAAFGYLTRSGLQVEAFWAGTRQSVDSPLSELGRNQVGIHVIVTRPMRIR